QEVLPWVCYPDNNKFSFRKIKELENKLNSQTRNVNSKKTWKKYEKVFKKGYIDGYNNFMSEKIEKIAIENDANTKVQKITDFIFSQKFLPSQDKYMFSDDESAYLDGKLSGYHSFAWNCIFHNAAYFEQAFQDRLNPAPRVKKVRPKIKKTGDWKEMI